MFRFDGLRNGVWSPVDAVPISDCTRDFGATRTPPVPGGEVSRLVVHQWTVDCSQELQVALSGDGSIWRWTRGGCTNDDAARWLVAYPFLSSVLSLVAWGIVVVGLRKSHTKSV